MARDLPSERPKFDRSRDTPGRDAYAMRMAARKKTKNMFEGRGDTSDLKASVAAKIRNKQYVTPAERAALAKTGAFGLRGPVGKAVKVGLDVTGISAIPQSVSDAYWSVTHPRDRLMGRGRAEQQTMAWVGGLRPQLRVPTRDPGWEIIRNKQRDVLVGLSGRYPYYKKPRGADTLRATQNYTRAERQMQQIGNYDDAIAQAILNQARRDRDQARIDRKTVPSEFTFSAVPTGTREAHATMQMNVFPEETYIDYISKLTDPFTRRGEDNLMQGQLDQFGATMPHFGYQPREVPIPVMLQLMMNALGPEKPMRSWIVNEQLERAMRKYAMRAGLPMTFDNGWGGGR